MWMHPYTDMPLKVGVDFWEIMHTWSISVTNHMHNEFVLIWGVGVFVPTCKILHMGITVCVRRVPIRIRAGIAKIRIWGVPLRITNLCAYGD